MASNGFVAFMQGVTGAGLFGKLRRPGAPTEFIDSRTVEEYIESGAFETTLSRYRLHVPERPAQPDYVNTFPDVSEPQVDRKPLHDLSPGNLQLQIARAKSRVAKAKAEARAKAAVQAAKRDVVAAGSHPDKPMTERR